MESEKPLGPFKLLSVNKVPERAKRLIAILANDVKDKYTLIHCANAETKEEVPTLASQHQPDLVFCASMWTKEESDSIVQTVRSIVPGVRTLVVPNGLLVEKGPDAVVGYVKERLDEVLKNET